MERVGETTSYDQRKMPGAGRAVLGQSTALNQCVTQETELSSILSTVLTQAQEIRSLTAGIYDRVTERCEPFESSDPQCFGSSYVGRAQEVRSVQSEVISLLIELSKIA